MSDDKDISIKTIKNKVSIIMPICDEFTYVKEAIDSIISQTYENWELIVVDGSKDRTGFEKVVNISDPRIKHYYRTKNGIADALNYSITKCDGEFIARMDGDDICEPDRIEKQVHFLLNHPETDILGTSYNVISEKGEFLEKRIQKESHEQIFANLIFENPICHPTVMFRRKVFDDGNKYSSVYAEDYDFWTKLIWEYKFANLKLCLFKYRKHNANTSAIGTDKCKSSDEQSCKEYIKKITHDEMIDVDLQCLIKNYRVFSDEKKINCNKAKFLSSQYVILKKIYFSSAELDSKIRQCICTELKMRWNKIAMLYSVVDENLRNYINGYIYELDEDYKEKIYKAAIENDSKINEIKRQNIRYYIYGNGKRGWQTLRCIEQMDLNWHFCGVVDKKIQEYTYMEKKETTIFPDEIDMNAVDYIFIANRNYYYEIYNNLLQGGISEKKIVGDSLFYF